MLHHPLHGEFLALLGAVEKIKIDQLLVRKSGLMRQCFEIVQDLRAQVDAHGSAGREERFLSAQADAFAGANAGEKVGLLRSK
jgi:hypothetical protein